MSKQSDLAEEVIGKFSVEPYEINNGKCGEFARHLKNAFTDHDIHAIRIVEDYIIKDCFAKGYTNHTWVYCYDDEKHYDAEAPTGVADPMKLPVFDRISDKIDESELRNNSIKAEVNHFPDH